MTHLPFTESPSDRIPAAYACAVVGNAVVGERARQERKHGANTLSNPRLETFRALAALVEEVGEVGRALTYDQAGTPDELVGHLFTELVQTAATAHAWAEGLLRFHGPDLMPLAQQLGELDALPQAGV